MFIVFEGIDGSGKTTLSECITNHLDKSGKKVVRYSEPTKFDTGLYIRKFLAGEMKLSKEEQLLAFIQDRELSVSKNILPSLSDGYIVILDRYYFSTAAYQASSDFPPEYILKLNIEKKFPIPDIVFFLDINPKFAFERLLKRGDKKEIFDNLHTLERIYSNFKKILPPNVYILDANNEIPILIENSLRIISNYSKLLS